MKRKYFSDLIVSQCTRSKRPKLFTHLENNKDTKVLVSASHLYNYMMKDTLVDWLKFKTKQQKSIGTTKKSKNFTEFIMNRGNQFEDELVKYIHNNRMPIVTVSKYITNKTLQQTKTFMKQGAPIIHSAPVRNIDNGTQGVIDLLIRSDHLNNLVEQQHIYDNDKPASKLGHPFHYVVIDIKFSTLPLKTDGIHLCNSGNYPAYKAQCLIYTEAVGKIQGYTPSCAFIIGRRWSCTKQKVTNRNYTCLNKLGKISYDTVDICYREITKNAIQWIRDLKKYGNQWSVNPPSRKELFPNMCIDSGKWNLQKQKIANHIGEMTSIWYVGERNRNTAIQNGIKSWYNKKCNSKIMNINGIRAPIIDAILNINRQTRDKIRPRIIQNNMYDWKTVSNELYIDFETISDIFANFDNLPKQDRTDMIFMIGVGWKQNETWKYKNFICKKPSYDEEYRIMNQFTDFLYDNDFPKLYFWSAETNLWKIAKNRQLGINSINKNHINTHWNLRNTHDLSKLFTTEPIVIKDCFKFGLKEIAKAMRKHNMISVEIESKCNSGMMAMINAWNCYASSKNPINSKIMKDISKYNEFDCKVLYEIISYLRENHV